MATQEYITSNAVPYEEQQAVKEWRQRPWNKALRLAIEQLVLKKPVFDAFDAMNFAQQYLPYALQDNEKPQETHAHHIVADAATLSIAENILENPSLRRNQRLRAQATVLSLVDRINERIAGTDDTERLFLTRIATDTHDITTVYNNEGRPKPDSRNFPYVSQEIRVRSRSLQRDFPNQYHIVNR